MSRVAAVPITGKVLRFVFSPPRWEVVQLVGLQTLDLAILVRVQASQPIFSMNSPTFTSSFVAAHGATVLDEKEGVLHLRIPGTLTQSSNLGRTTYRAAIEVYVLPNRTAG